MWEIRPISDGDLSGFRYQEAHHSDLQSKEAHPVEYLARVLGIKTKSISKIEKSIPTWLKPSEIDGENLLSLKSDSRDWSNAVRVQVPESEWTSPGAVWLENSFVLIQKPAGITELEVIYTVPDTDHSRNLRFEREIGGPSTAILEWYGTIGVNTTELSGEEEFKGPGRIKRALLSLSTKAGLFFGRVVRYQANAISRSQTDPLQKSRRRALEKKAGDLAIEIPDICDYLNNACCTDYHDSENIDRELVILVHGTFSCGMRMLAAMDEFGMNPTSSNVWLRFEHDTFLPIIKNADELTELIREVVQLEMFSRIILVGHSRGGLVSVISAGQLTGGTLEITYPYRSAKLRRNRDLQIEVCTFGTPHAGTPLVAGAEGVSNVLRSIAKTSARMATSSLGADPVGWAFGYAIGRVSFPRGISAMNPDSDFIQLYRQMLRAFPITSAGGYLDTNSENDGFFEVGKLSALGEIMGGQLHDGVVPYDSSVAIGDPICKPAKQCGHSDYFSREDTLGPLRDRLERGRWE